MYEHISELSNVLDTRGLNSTATIEKFIEKEENLLYKYPFWTIHHTEPLRLYDYLTNNDYFFETFIISYNEYRIYIGGKY